MKRYIGHLVRLQKKQYSGSARCALTVLVPVLFMLFIGLIVWPAFVLHERFALAFGLGQPAGLWVGSLVLLLGLALYLWTIVLFARAGGTQVPAVPTQRLVTDGPYAVTRNPMVTGTCVIILGLGLMLDSASFVLLAAPVPIAYIIYIWLVEEKELEARFGEKYREYRRQTPFIIPRWPGGRRLGRTG